MYITSIHICNFRNYRRLDVSVEPSINVLYGENAQGKTNLIEALYLCACARSHRTAKDRELILHGESQYTVEIVLAPHGDTSRNEGDRAVAPSLSSNDRKSPSHTNYEETITLTYQDASDGVSGPIKPKRIAYQDHVPFEKISDFLGLFHAVIFAPEDLLLIKDGPSVRRRYLDLLISQVRPRYFHDLSTYSRLLQQKNKTIKNLRQRKSLHTLTEAEISELEIWDYPLAEAAAGILVERILFIERIRRIAGEKHEQISGGKEHLFVRYRTVPGLLTDEIQTDPSGERTVIRDFLLSRWKSSEQDDYEKGSVTYGPHRDDLELSLDGDGLRAFASQGQQRSAALALKLSELKILREETGENPVLLLDDVFSELDASRRACLLRNIEDAQVFITCTDRTFIEKELTEVDTDTADGNGKPWNITFFRVEDGAVYRK